MGVKVRVTKSGDSNLYPGQVVDLDEFVKGIKVILLNGGEMPVAVLYPFQNEVGKKVAKAVKKEAGRS